MKFEKKLKIRNKVFCDADIKALWEFIVSQTKTNLKGSAGIVVVNKDETVSSQCEDIFMTPNYLQKNIKRIELGYHSKDYNSHVTISIEYTDGVYFLSDNYIEIQGETSDWVELCASKIQNILTNVNATSLLARFYSNGGQFVTIMLFSMVFWKIFSDFIIPTIKMLTTFAAIKIALALVFLSVGVAAIWFIGRISSIFPIVSIDINGIVRNRNKKIICFLKWFFTSIILPLLFGWLFYTLSTAKDGNTCVFEKNDTVKPSQQSVQ